MPLDAFRGRRGLVVFALDFGAGGRGFKSPACINLLSSHDFNEEEESCRRGLSSREDAAMLGI